MNARLFLLALWISGGSLMAQTAGSPGEGLCAVPGSTAGTMQICWWGKNGRTYFLQSNATLNRDTWSYTPVLESGGNAVLSYSMPSTAQRMFVRLVYTDLPNGGNAASADFDQDGVPNGMEVDINGTHSDPFLADSDWDGYTDGEEMLAGSSPSNPGSNPGSANPPSGAPANPSADYINGIKVEYSKKNMWASYNRGGSAASATSGYRGTHNLPPNGVLALDYQAQTSVTGSNATATMIGIYEGATFHPDRIVLPGQVLLSTLRQDVLNTPAGGPHTEFRYLSRSILEIKETLSSTAPADVQRTLLAIVSRFYNGQRVSRDLGTITLSKVNTVWSPELYTYCKKDQGKPLTFEMPPDGNAPSSGTTGESKVETTDARLVSVEIQEVRFSGTGYHELKSDDGQTTYNAPQWKDVNGDGKGITHTSGDRGYPVAYTKGSLPSIGANFKFTGMITGQSYEIKATSLQGVEIPPTAVTLGTDGSMILPPTGASKGFVDTVEFYDAKDNTAFELDWHIKIGSSNWAKIASTKHTVCVINANPLNSLTSRQETLFVLACKNAKGKTQASDITTGIWGEFTDRKVTKANGIQMSYYKSYLCNVVTAEELINQGDGQCGSWADLFVKLLKVHGIDNQNEVVEVVSDGGANGLVVKDWNFANNGTSGHPTYTYLNIPSSNLIDNASYNWRYSEVSDVAGIEGQGNPNPASYFNLHYIVEIQGVFYDPSYGTSYSSLAGLDANISGYYIEGAWPVDEPDVNLDLNGDGHVQDNAVNTLVNLFRANPSGINIKESRRLDL